MTAGDIESSADDKLEVRLVAIHTLRYIAEGFPEYATPVLDLLTTYLTERVPDYGDEPPPPDVQEISRMIRSRKPE
jgi:hypothetical protein